MAGFKKGTKEETIKKVLELHRQGYDYKQIADILGTPAAKVSPTELAKKGCRK